MSFTVNEVEDKIRTKFAFEHERKTGHSWYVLRIEGVANIRIMFSQSGKQTVRRTLESKMARELGVKTAFFREMVGCTKSRQDYFAALEKAAKSGELDEKLTYRN